MLYQIHVAIQQRKTGAGAIPIPARAGIVGAPEGPSELIPGRYTTAAPEIIGGNYKSEPHRIRKIQAVAAQLMAENNASRARFSIRKEIGSERPPAPDYEWAQPAPRMKWEDWDFNPEPEPAREEMQPLDFSLEVKPFYFPTGKMRKDKEGKLKPELKPAGEIATALCGEREFSVVRRSKRVSSVCKSEKLSMPLSAALKSIARIAGEENATAAREAFLAVAPGLE